MKPHETISAAIRRARDAGFPALMPYVTAGFPRRESFRNTLLAIASVADVIEVGVPFTDPMADGTTIQRSSRVALEQGVTLKWILSELAEMRGTLQVPVLLMTYLNPLMSFGFEKLAKASAQAGVAGFIVPDLPYEESADLREKLEAEGLALVQMVSPVTPPERVKMLCEASRGFVYAVTMTGTTGRNIEVLGQVLEYMDRVRASSPVPVCAGFGIRSHSQVAQMAAHVDGVAIGAALVEVLERGEDPAAFLRTLRGR
jgi:tryptophan synthase alpha chain